MDNTLHVTEAFTKEPGLNDRLIQLSEYILRTCQILRVIDGSGRHVEWDENNNPKLSISAEVVELPNDNKALKVVSSVMKVEYPDIGYSLKVSRKFKSNVLDDGDQIGLRVLEGFSKHYKRTRNCSVIF